MENFQWSREQSHTLHFSREPELEPEAGIHVISKDCVVLAAKNVSNLKKPGSIVKKIIPQNPSSLAMTSFMTSSAPPPMERRRESLKFLEIKDSFM
jgi:hypothetical protein